MRGSPLGTIVGMRRFDVRASLLPAGARAIASAANERSGNQGMGAVIARRSAKTSASAEAYPKPPFHQFHHNKQNRKFCATGRMARLGI